MPHSVFQKPLEALKCLGAALLRLLEALECPLTAFSNRFEALECPATAFSSRFEALECRCAALQRRLEALEYFGAGLKHLRHWSTSLVVPWVPRDFRVRARPLSIANGPNLGDLGRPYPRVEPLAKIGS